jgi:hypothetical protein
MNLDDAEREIVRLGRLGRLPLAKRVYLIPSDWVPLTDVLAVLTRFRKHQTDFRPSTTTEEAKVLSEVFGES